MKLQNAIPGYEAITKLTVLNPRDDYEEFIEEHFAEQKEKLKELGIDYEETECLLHVFKPSWRKYQAATPVLTMTLDDAILEFLDLKEGCDLVKFENGHIGFVGYYGNHKTAFEVIDVIEYE